MNPQMNADSDPRSCLIPLVASSEHSEFMTPPWTNDELAAIVAIANSESLRELSLVQLLEQTGYRALRQQLSIALVQRYLKEHPEHLEVWEQYSEDKRTDGGSYLCRLGPLWEVGELTTGRRKFFLSRSRACATFILRELDATATDL